MTDRPQRPPRWVPVYDALRPVARRIARRERLDAALDRLRLRLDTFPDGLYQPVPTLGVRMSQRAGSESRWNEIRRLLGELEPATAVDIGANAGYFSLELARQGVAVVAIESDPANVRTLLLAVRHSGSPRVAVMSLQLSPDTVALVPPADAILCLAVWHHFVRSYGLEPATELLGAIWARARMALVFESGPFPGGPEDLDGWLRERLELACPGGRLQSLGTHEAADPDAPPRQLFAVIRR